MNDRIDYLEARLRQLERELLEVGRVQIPKQVRLAKTVVSPTVDPEDPQAGEGEYPDGPTDSCWVVFVNADGTERQDPVHARVEAWTVGGVDQFYDEGATLAVAWYGGKWWILGPPDNVEHWGTLDADLAWNDTVGVAVSVWLDDLSGDSGDNIENVLAPWTMQSGTIPSGTRVLIRRIGGIWFVVLAPCDEEEV